MEKYLSDELANANSNHAIVILFAKPNVVRLTNS